MSEVPEPYAGPDFTLAQRMAEAIRDDIQATLEKWIGSQADSDMTEAMRVDIIDTMMKRYRLAVNVAVSLKVTDDGKLQPHFDEARFFNTLMDEIDENG